MIAEMTEQDGRNQISDDRFFDYSFSFTWQNQKYKCQFLEKEQASFLAL